MSYLRELVDSRELLANLILRETKGQYKRTIFGRLWALANPLFQMLIYTFVFGFIFRATPAPGNPSGLNVFSLWLLCGLLPWTFFAAVINQGMVTLVLNAGLIQKVYFTRAVLPLAVVGSVGYNWLFEMLVLVVALALFGSFVYPWIPLVLIAMVLLAAFATGFALVLAVLNVHFRDLQYFMAMMLTLWMYMTPIVYPISLVAYQSERIGPLLGHGPTILEIYRWNPMERFVEVFRNLLYDNRLPTAADSIFITVAAGLSLVIGLWIFHRNERGLAEAL
ncbi:MAG: ABC transporter permease [Microbacteriaceae bacterium]